VRGLGGQAEGLDEQEAGQVRPHAVEGAGAELREGVVAAVGRDDVVAGLRAAVEADDRADAGSGAPAGVGRGAEPVHGRALAGVAVAEVHHDRVPHADQIHGYWFLRLSYQRLSGRLSYSASISSGLS
jgi:hypothetical protein